MIDLEHSPLGGSSAARFMTCTASFLVHRQQLQDGEFEEIETEFAKLGTAAHELAARCVAENVEPYEFLGEEFGGYLAGWPEQISLDAVAVYFLECSKIMREAKERNPAKRTLLIEDTLHLPDIHPLLKGTVDFGYWSMLDGVFLRDYKNGEGVAVAAPNNRQLLYYAFLIIMSDPWLRAADRSMRVSLGIVQPNFYGIYEDADVWETTLGHVIDWGHNELLPTMNRLMVTQDVLPTDYVEGDHCQFCPVLLDCPLMQRAFTAYAEGDEDFVAMLTNEELDKYYTMRAAAKRFQTQLERVIYARKVTGGNIPSAKLVEKKTARVWRPGAAAAIKARFGADGYTKPEVKSPAQIEKISSDAKAFTLEWGYKPEAATLTIAPLSDPRPEAKPRTNAEVFKAHAKSPEEMGF